MKWRECLVIATEHITSLIFCIVFKMLGVRLQHSPLCSFEKTDTQAIPLLISTLKLQMHKKAKIQTRLSAPLINVQSVSVPIGLCPQKLFKKLRFPESSVSIFLQSSRTDRKQTDRSQNHCENSTIIGSIVFWSVQFTVLVYCQVSGVLVINNS